MRIYDQAYARKLPINAFKNLASTTEGIDYIK